MLDMLGLEEADNIVYGHIVHRFDCTAEQIAKALGLPSRQVGDSIARLIRAGLVCTEQVGKLRPTPNGPMVAADRLRAQVDAEYARKRSSITALYGELAGLLERHPVLGSVGLAPTVDRIGDPEAARLQVTELLGAARREVARITPAGGPGAPGRTHLDHEPAELAALRRGVRLRLVYPSGFFTDDRLRDTVRPRLNEGGQVRMLPEPPVDLLLLDRQAVVLTEGGTGPSGHATLIVRGRGLVEALDALFQACWSQASGIDHLLDGDQERPDGDPLRLAATDRAMLTLLGEGAKDELVARRLGISVRTVRRRVSELLRMMDATSRFQGGVLAERRGWIGHGT
ncbi:helix-turn-helix domain-containing protein [Actinomadura sp. NPDC048394]|jgi:predicted DNA-binding transcriptional regulator|uniref:helix-turn-helix domain-containing protein n=1 Tax=Actinomadura sp. NPDC048394 TaxID=3158223 RepID=UPI0033EE2A8E